MTLAIVRPFSITLNKGGGKLYPVLAMLTNTDGDYFFLVPAEGNNKPCWIVWEKVVAIFGDEDIR